MKKLPVSTAEKERRVDVWRYKTYQCRVKLLDIKTGKKIVVLNEDEARDHDVYSGYRTELKSGSRTSIAIVDTSRELVKTGYAGIFVDLAEDLRVRENDIVEIIHLNRPASIEYIRKKLDKQPLKENEIFTIVSDIVDGKLSEVEIAVWISAAYVNGLSDEEIVSLTRATVASGDNLELNKKPILDKHSIGGVAGNRTTPIVVSIIAANGLYIPKTSSKAITSAAGTADTFSVLANVDFSIEELREIVLKAKGAVVWGGGMKLAPVDDKLIRIRNPLSLDPEGMLLASILGKKKSVGAEYAVIDIPVGRSAKVPYKERAEELAHHFLGIAKSIDIKLEALITDGAEPIGNGIGPALECRDFLAVLEGKGPQDLYNKSIFIAGKLMELSGHVSVGRGFSLASSTIQNGKALAKLRQIIELQGGNPKIKSSDIRFGSCTYDVKHNGRSGQIFHIDNKVIAKIARLAGAPTDHGAGVYLHCARGDRVKNGDKIFTIYAHNESKLSFAIKALEDLQPIEMRRMLLGNVV